MKISYGFVYYFSIAMMSFTVALVFLYFKPIRHAWFKLIDHFGIGRGHVFKLVFWITFIIIGVILVDSILSFLSMKK
jgi:hypothetical protein